MVVMVVLMSLLAIPVGPLMSQRGNARTIQRSEPSEPPDDEGEGEDDEEAPPAPHPQMPKRPDDQEHAPPDEDVPPTEPARLLVPADR
jgi:hypothetical protein